MSRLPFLVKDEPAQLIVDGKPFLMLAGEVHNSSAGDSNYIERSLARLEELHCNTALVPVSWELVEPREDQFDWSLVDATILAARRHGLRLVLLWFGTWKNTFSSYAPEWVKTDLQRFLRAETTPGVKMTAISSLSTEARKADARAFAALMRHIAEVDGAEQTVLMVQVENETGLLLGPRDVSPLAEEAFQGPVPTQLLEALEQQRQQGSLIPEFQQLWEKAGNRTRGTWSEVFGADANEVFMTWHIASFVGEVTQAGKQEYPLPMFVNAWLIQYADEPAGHYPSGGPVSKMMDVWRIAAPAIDLFAPDIYIPHFKQVCRDYTQSHNPLFIPEANVTVAAANVFYAFAEHAALGFAPFGADGDEFDSTELRTSYALLKELLPLLARYRGTGQTRGIVQETAEKDELHFGDYVFEIRYQQPRSEGRLPARGLVIETQPGEYFIVGAGFEIDFHHAQPGHHVDYLSLEEGHFKQGIWVPGRRLNGDELRTKFDETLIALKVRLYAFS